MILVEPSRELHITANGIYRFTDPETDQRNLEFIAEVTQDIEEAPLLAMRASKKVVNFINHDHAQAEVAQKVNDTNFKGSDILRPHCNCCGRCTNRRKDRKIESTLVRGRWRLQKQKRCMGDTRHWIIFWCIPARKIACDHCLADA